MKWIRCLLTFAFFAGFLVMMVCGSTTAPPASSTPKEISTPSEAQNKEPILYTGQDAFKRMMGSARRWTLDAVPVRMEAALTSESNGQGGKSTVWRAYVASPSRGRVKIFVCSGSRLPDAPPSGVSSKSLDTPLTQEFASMVFDPLYLKIDSDKAYSEALDHGGKALLKKNPQQPVTYALEWNAKDRVLIWYVIFGAKREGAKGMAAVNASTGKLIWAK
jgi:hypothetical protein